MNAYGAFVDAHTITATKKNGKVDTITAVGAVHTINPVVTHSLKAPGFIPCT
jgi:hypothetical protein